MSTTAAELLALAQRQSNLVTAIERHSDMLADLIRVVDQLEKRIARLEVSS